MEPPSNDAPDAASAYDERGVDRTLVRWMLSLTPSERLQSMQTSSEQLQRLRQSAIHAGALEPKARP